MKMKKMTAAALSLCMLAGGVMYDIPAVNEISVSAEVISGDCYTFDSATGVMTLRGNVKLKEISGFSNKDAVKSIAAEKGTVFPLNCYNLFGGYSNCTSMDLSNVDTSNVRDMRSMFSGCSALTSLDISGFDTSNVINMTAMFTKCSSLTSLDVSGFDTSNVTSMAFMFQLCSSLTSLDVSGFDTRNVVNMSDMFDYCQALSSLDVSGFDTSNVTNLSNMFTGCSALTSLDVSGFDTSNAAYMWYMFSECEKLTSLDVSGFDTSNVTNVSGIFANCKGLKFLTIGKNFKEITEDLKLPNKEIRAISSTDPKPEIVYGWVNANATDKIISGTGTYAVFTNTGKNTYIRLPLPTESITGDINGDSKADIADAVLLQKWILQSPGAALPVWENADICSDGVIDVFDLIALKQLIIKE